MNVGVETDAELPDQLFGIALIGLTELLAQLAGTGLGEGAD